ncbi:MAG: glycosyltransferase family 39 protein [Candidatus Omnitrophota bacterium]
MGKIAIPVILFVLALAVFTYQANVVGLEFKGDESFYFQSAKQMLDTGDWVTPYYFDTPRFQKPPLFYWIVASFFKIFGIDWSSSRLPSAISMALVVALTYVLALRFYDKSAAIMASLIMISTIATFRYARLALPEAFFLLLLSLTIFLLLNRRYYPAYVVMGFAFLIKGPVGIILPLFIMAAYRYSMGEKGFFKEIKLVPGIVITLAIGLPWYLAMIKIHGLSYLDHIFYRETIERISGFSFGKIFYFLPVIFIFYLPWSFFLIPSMKNTVGEISQGSRPKDGAVFSLVWFLAVLIFFTFLGEKHRHYMLAASVPLAIMLGHYFSRLFLERGVKRALALFVPFLLSFFIYEAVMIGMGREIGGITAIFKDNAYNIEKSDTVAIGSHTIVPQELEISVNHPVEKFCYKWPDRRRSDQVTTERINRVLFGDGRVAYLLIKKTDFYKHITPSTKKRLTILEKGYMYSKGVGAARIFDAMSIFTKKAFLDLFRDEVYFVTNKEDI